jgi:excisionase family DNA binding protein
MSVTVRECLVNFFLGAVMDQSEVERLFSRIETELRALRQQREPVLMVPKGEAARLLSVSLSTVKRLVRSGHLVATQVNAKQLISTKELGRFAAIGTPNVQGRSRKGRSGAAAEARSLRRKLRS